MNVEWMRPYPSIKNIYKLNPDDGYKSYLKGCFTFPEYEFLSDNVWCWYEKIDGMNIRVGWEPLSRTVTIAGRTDKANIREMLTEYLTSLFSVEKLCAAFEETAVTFYGEGCGAGTSTKGSGKYGPKEPKFELFDVVIGGYWLQQKDVLDIGLQLGVLTAPLMGKGYLFEAVYVVSQKPLSHVAPTDVVIEGFVCRPEIELMTRTGHRVITKIKHCYLK